MNPGLLIEVLVGTINFVFHPRTGSTYGSGELPTTLEALGITGKTETAMSTKEGLNPSPILKWPNPPPLKYTLSSKDTSGKFR